MKSGIFTVLTTVKIDKNKVQNDDDYVTNSIGAFGLWQFIYVFIASLTRWIASWTIMSVVFLAPETDFVCTKFNNATAVTDALNNTCYSNCIEYEYYNDIFEDSMLSEFGLICEKTWLRSFTQMVLMLGVLCGVCTFGWFSDRFGRSKAMVLSGIICAISMFGTAFCSSYVTIAVCRFITGIGTGGYLTLTAVYVSELVGTSVIDVVLCSSLLPMDGIGLPILAAFGYFTSTWRSFMIVSSSMTVLIVCVTFFLTETPRWFVAKGNDAKAIELMTRAAKLNNLDVSNISEKVTKITDQVKIKDKKDIDLTYLDLFRTKKLAIWTLASVSMWFVTGFSFFGLTQYISQLGSHLYIVVSVLGIGQIISAPLSIFIMKFFNRKSSSIFIYSTIGVFSLSLMFTPNGSTATIVLGTMGVIAASISFFVVYVIVIELYPTSMRNMGLSCSSVGSKVAGMVAPFVVNMESKWIASSIFTVVAFSAVISCLLLPETKGKKLKDSIDDMEK